VHEHLLRNKIIWNLWRGKMGLTKEEAEKEYDKNKNE
jgi:hypothetical protein